MWWRCNRYGNLVFVFFVMISGKLHRKWLFCAKFYVIFKEKSLLKRKNGLFRAKNVGFSSFFEPEYVKNLKNYIEISGKM